MSRLDGSTGFGVIGGRSFIGTAAVIPAIDAADGAHLAAIAARSGPVADTWSHAEVDSYQAVIDHPDVDVVYIPLPNDQHREWTEAAAAAGKHVLCEKPLAPTPAEAEAMASACADAGVILAEAWMTPFGDRWSALMGRAASGDLGDVRSIDTAFTFTIGPGNEANYRWDPAQGGGALLDVGIYALGPAVHLWGAAPERIDATRHMSDRGIDLTTEGTLEWSDGRRASFEVSFERPENQSLAIEVANGERFDVSPQPHTGDPTVENPYRAMVEAMAASVRGDTAWPRPPGDAIAMLTLLERIAAEATA